MSLFFPKFLAVHLRNDQCVALEVVDRFGQKLYVLFHLPRCLHLVNFFVFCDSFFHSLPTLVAEVMNVLETMVHLLEIFHQLEIGRRLHRFSPGSLILSSTGRSGQLFNFLVISTTTFKSTLRASDVGVTGSTEDGVFNRLALRLLLDVMVGKPAHFGLFRSSSQLL